MDPAFDPSLTRPASGGELANGTHGDMPGRAGLPVAEGVGGSERRPPTRRTSMVGQHAGFEGPDESGRRAQPGRVLRVPVAPPAAGSAEGEPALTRPGSLSMDTSDSEDPLARARSHAESLAAQAHAEAEELLSRANAQAELLRMHAEAMRAEAECLRAEAGALRAAARPGFDIPDTSTGSSADEARRAAEDFRAALHGDVEAARAEFEQMKADAMRIRQALRTEIDAGLADAQRMREEVQGLCAETNQLAAELRLLFAMGAPEGGGVEGDPARRPTNGRASSDPGPDPTSPGPAAPVGPEAAPRPQVPDAQLEANLIDVLRLLWDAANRGQPVRDEPSVVDTDVGGPGQPSGPQVLVEDDALHGPAVVRRASEPLIGSGGWRGREAGSAGVIRPGDTASPPSPGRRRRRLRK